MILHRRLLVPLVPLALAAAVPPAAEAASSYCSPTGDYCHSATERDGAVRLAFTTFSFRGRLRVCVTGPAGEKSCKRFRLRERASGTFSFSVRWSRHFPDQGAGTYRVAFRRGGTRLGPRDTFRRG